MADISQINLPDGSSYNVKDASALHNITVPEYDATQTYNVGDFVTYNGNVYMCIIQIEEPEAWDSNRWRLVDADQSYLHSLNPKGAGSFSLNRKHNTTIGVCSFAEGFITTASAIYSHAEGYTTTASGNYSHAEGSNTTASGTGSHAEGYNSIASGSNSHAEGRYPTASGQYSHAEGHFTIASGTESHAEGSATTASGVVSHSEGDTTTASGYASHAEGYNTTANHKSQHTFGEYNVEDPSTAETSNRGNYVEIVGNGTANNARSNARTLDWSGNETLSGGLTSTSVSTTTLSATTLNGATIGSSPKFTDNNTTYTFEGGTNKFTVTPSNSNKFDVTVTPSITNNVTGSGTSGYIAKFNSTNTITNGPAFGSSTTTYLRNDGSWATPSQPTVGNGTITIQLNGTNKGSFTTNQSGNGTININGVQTSLSTSDASSSLSVSGNLQSVTKKLFKYGNVVELFITGNVKTAIADNGTFFTVPSGYNPKVNDAGFTFFTGSDPYIPTGMKFGYFTWGGRDFHTLGALGVGTQVTVHITYLI